MVCCVVLCWCGLGQAISPELYATFWSLTSYDLDVPKAAYEAAISKCNSSIAKIDADSKMADKTGGEANDEKGLLRPLLCLCLCLCVA